MNDAEILKRQMMELWKETFHDTDRYIRLVFDTYFKPENVFYQYDGDNLISAMLTVPYDFIFLSDTEDKVRMTGMYLCGLATRQEYRRKGIMSDLMHKAEQSAKQRGFDLTFLIPADSNLREYYRKKNYFDASYRHSERIYKNNILNKNTIELNFYSIKYLLENGKVEMVDQLAEKCHMIEKNATTPTLIHSERDMVAVMKENENSFFLTSQPFDLKYPILEKVTSVVFPNISEKQNGEIEIVDMFCFQNPNDSVDNIFGLNETNEISIFAVIFKRYPEHEIIRLRKACIRSADNTDRVEEEPYAMIKILSNEKFCNVQEKQPLKISLMLD